MTLTAARQHYHRLAAEHRRAAHREEEAYAAYRRSLEPAAYDAWKRLAEIERELWTDSRAAWRDYDLAWQTEAA